jgi:hypothetical protein
VSKQRDKANKSAEHTSKVLSDKAMKQLTNMYRRWEAARNSTGGEHLDRRKRLENTIKGLLKNKRKAEALSWLKGGNKKSYRYLAEWTTEQSIEWVECLYERGAAEVWAVEFDRNAGYESINTLIVTLPPDKKKRRSVLELTNRQIHDDGFDPEEDYGQRHLYVWFD